MDLAAFRAAYPEFASVPDETVTAAAASTTCYIPNPTEEQTQLLTAHLLTIRGLNDQGGGGVGQLTSASIGSVSTTRAAPPSRNEFRYWLASTAYGSQLLACLARKTAGGRYLGGAPERSGFRKAGGRY